MNCNEFKNVHDSKNNLDEQARLDNLLCIVNELSLELLSVEENAFHYTLDKSVERIALCIEADRIYIWRNDIKNSELNYTLEFEWKSELGKTLTSYASEDHYVNSFPEWEAKLLKNECVNGPLSSIEQCNTERLRRYGVKSVLIMPINLHGQYWGFICCDNCHKEYKFNEEEMKILRSGALIIASAINHIESSIQIREAEVLTRLMLDATPLCCTVWDVDYNLIDCNIVLMKLLGIDDKQSCIQQYYDLMPEFQPDGSNSLLALLGHLNDAFCDGGASFEWTYHKTDGTQIPVEATLIRIDYGNSYIVAGYARDLSGYMEMMQQIAHKDSLLHTVNDVATIMLQSDVHEFENDLWCCLGMMADSVGVDRVYIWKNHMEDGILYSSQIYEWSEGAMPQQGNEYTVNIPYSETAPEWEEKLSSGFCINSLVRNMSPSEQAMLTPQSVLSLLVVPVFLRDEFWGFVGFDDCHCEREFSSDEEAILRSGSLLIANSLLRNEITQSLHSAVTSMELAYEEAKEASLAKSNFLSNMSHEMRTPMNAIIGMTMIGKTAENKERKDYAFGKIEDASNHLLGVINDVLDMSKIEANKFELSEVEFDFEKVLQNSINVINFRINEKRQHFTVHLDRNIPLKLTGDSQRLTQVITNLLSNAVKFTHEGGNIRLDARLISEEDDICTMQIEISDTGIGITPEQQKRLFKSFEQAESSISRKFGGTGLGLAISKHIVELMSGEIWLESEPGSGSTFAFTVQLKRSGTAGTESLLNPEINWANLRILVVDDEPETREYFAAISEQLGFYCDTAKDGYEALQCIENTFYNIFFIDWNMPEMNGAELSNIIKTRNLSKSVIIMISSADWNELGSVAGDAGIELFIQKPLFSSSIVDSIIKCIGVQEQHTSHSQMDKDESLEDYRILLAEDMEVNREIVCAMLEPTMVEIECACNGIETLEMFKKDPEYYDIIFMDVQMPEMDGLEATRRIRALGSSKAETIPIIAMTANVFKEDIEKCLEAGMNDHMGKPLNIDEVIGKLQHWLLN